jgi:Cu-processing system ATP-binding protein
MPDYRIEVRNVCRRFGDVQALDGVNLAIGSGRMVGLIGHNGAGKSTLFKIMLGLVAPDSGDVLVDGAPVAGPRFREARRRIGYLPETFATYDNLTGGEVLRLFADLKRVPRHACWEVLERVGLAHAAGRRVAGYSKGMRQRLGFAQVLLGAPDLVFLDEPTNGLDPEGIHDFYQVLREVQAGGTTVVITSHILADIQERVDELVILRGGRVAAQGTLEELRAATSLRARVEVRVREGESERIGEGLAHMGLVAVESAAGRLRIECGPDEKVTLIARLAALGHGALLDITVQEASLEQLFLGFGGKHGSH